MTQFARPEPFFLKLCNPLGKLDREFCLKQSVAAVPNRLFWRKAIKPFGPGVPEFDRPNELPHEHWFKDSVSRRAKRSERASTTAPERSTDVFWKTMTCASLCPSGGSATGLSIIDTSLLLPVTLRLISDRRNPT
jgi:hypothetical protein